MTMMIVKHENVRTELVRIDTTKKRVIIPISDMTTTRAARNGSRYVQYGCIRIASPHFQLYNRKSRTSSANRR